MHLESHVKAFQAQWIIKYLDPRDSPWKDVLDHWLLQDDGLGRGTLLRRGHTDQAYKLPLRSIHMRACLTAFANLGLAQDTSLLTHETQGESLFFNNRFPSPLEPHLAEEWYSTGLAVTLSDLIKDDDTMPAGVGSLHRQVRAKGQRRWGRS